MRDHGSFCAQLPARAVAGVDQRAVELAAATRRELADEMCHALGSMRLHEACTRAELELEGVANRTRPHKFSPATMLELRASMVAPHFARGELRALRAAACKPPCDGRQRHTAYRALRAARRCAGAASEPQHHRHRGQDTLCRTTAFPRSSHLVGHRRRSAGRCIRVRGAEPHARLRLGGHGCRD